MTIARTLSAASRGFKEHPLTRWRSVPHSAAMTTTTAISKAVLITGCSTGIGRATALLLAERGYPVYATARRLDSIADLAIKGCRTLQLDVCDEASMAAAVQTIEASEGAVGVLVNNAGYGLEGAFET